ncbi:hypothetical protein C8R45DRAFT_949468 [Mycena sanguinolenta]|nr:hypothetical protein C8R45DRAFT_949468 [Mycena sanguinolenta]
MYSQDTMSMLADKHKSELQPKEEPPPYSTGSASSSRPISVLPPLPPEAYASPEPRPPLPGPSLSFTQIDLHTRSDDITGTFYVDPQKPTNELTNKKKKKPKKKAPDARFITGSGKIAIDLATTGHVRDAPKASVVVTSKSGNITLNLLPADESRPRLDLNVTNNSGKVVVFIPRTYGGPIQLETKSGSLEFLPALSQHLNIVKAGDTESLVLFGTPSSQHPTDFCQIRTRSGKIIVGLKDEDKVVEELGFWQRLFHPRPSRPPSPQPASVS